MYISKILKEIPTTIIEEIEISMSLNQYIANRIKTLRTEKGLNFTDLSKITYDKSDGNKEYEISNTTISNVEKYLENDEKYANYKFSNLGIIANALEVDIMELFPYKEYYEYKHAVENTQKCNQAEDN